MRNSVLSIAGLLFLTLFATTWSCQNSPKTLPYIGDRVDLSGDTLIHRIADFSFVNQLGDTITNVSYAGITYVTDFFFTSCPSICPIVKKQMLRIYDHIGERTDVLLVSHTIDPKRDSVTVLKTYAENLGVDHARWHFLTGDKEKLLDIADDYFVAAYEDPSAPGGFDHSGKIILVDRNGRIRSFCDGTDPESVDDFLKDINVLLATYP